MPLLSRPPELALRGAAHAVRDKVSLRVAEGDRMFEGDAAHYLGCGASALNLLHAASGLAGLRPRRILDFGAGAGRVTRWLRAQWPRAQIFATDLRAADLAFCEAEFGCSTWISGTDVAALAAPSRFDLIWAGSVLTHLDEARALALLARLLEWTRPEGVVVASLHGRHAAGRGPASQFYGLGEAGWARLVGAFEAGEAYAYADYPFAAPGYGISLSRPDWTARLPERLPETRLLLFGERVWDDHHDVVALQRRAIDAA